MNLCPQNNQKADEPQMKNFYITYSDDL